MIIPSKQKNEVLRYILTEGVILVEDKSTGKHEQTGIDNLYVKSITRSLTDRGALKKVFVMKHGYYRLTEEGIVLLREQLGLPENFYPCTHSGDMGKESVVENEKIQN